MRSVGDFLQDLELLDYSLDQVYPNFVITKINSGKIPQEGRASR